MAASFRILVVDDEPDICEILSFNLTKDGYTVETANSAEEALERDPARFDLLLLDVMMGEISGFQLASRLKADPNAQSVPIIFLTAKDSENDAVTGLDLGADDYITKPFSIREVKARIQAVLRRYGKVRESILSFKGLSVDLIKKAVTVDGQPVSLTRIEFELLSILMGSPGKVFSRQELIAGVWSEEEFVLDRTVDVNITRLRKKIEPYSSSLRTRSGYGYYIGE